MSLDDPFSYEDLITLFPRYWALRLSVKSRADQNIFLTMHNLGYKPHACWVGMMKSTNV